MCGCILQYEAHPTLEYREHSLKVDVCGRMLLNITLTWTGEKMPAEKCSVKKNILIIILLNILVSWFPWLVFFFPGKTILLAGDPHGSPGDQRGKPSSLFHWFPQTDFIGFISGQYSFLFNWYGWKKTALSQARRSNLSSSKGIGEAFETKCSCWW